MIEVFLLLWWLAASVIVGFVCTVAGGNKGVGGVRWFILALLIGPFALVAVAAMPDLKTRRILRLIAEQHGVRVTEDDEEMSAVDRANEILKKKRGY